MTLVKHLSKRGKGWFSNYCNRQGNLTSSRTIAEIRAIKRFLLSSRPVESTAADLWKDNIRINTLIQQEHVIHKLIPVHISIKDYAQICFVIMNGLSDGIHCSLIFWIRNMVRKHTWSKWIWLEKNKHFHMNITNHHNYRLAPRTDCR